MVGVKIFHGFRQVTGKSGIYIKKTEIPEGDLHGENEENKNEKQGGTSDGQYAQRGRSSLYDEMPAFFLCADGRAAAFAGSFAVPVQPAGKCGEYRYYCNLHSGYFFGGTVGGKKGWKPEVFMGIMYGSVVFCRVGAGFFCSKQKYSGCGFKFCHRFLSVRRQRHAGRDGFQVTAGKEHCRFSFKN